jgi:hypothetical protein
MPISGPTPEIVARRTARVHPPMCEACQATPGFTRCHTNSVEAISCDHRLTSTFSTHFRRTRASFRGGGSRSSKRDQAVAQGARLRARLGGEGIGWTLRAERCQDERNGYVSHVRLHGRSPRDG